MTIDHDALLRDLQDEGFGVLSAEDVLGGNCCVVHFEDAKPVVFSDRVVDTGGAVSWSALDIIRKHLTAAGGES